MTTLKASALKVEAVRISELSVGDLVLCHGGVFRLTVLNYDAAEADLPNYGNVRSFSSEFVGDCQDVLGYGAGCVIPLSWRTVERPWTVQSNDLPLWSKVSPRVSS